MFLFNSGDTLNLHAINFLNSTETYFRIIQRYTEINVFYFFNSFRIIILSCYLYFIFFKQYDTNKFMVVSISCMLILTDSVNYYFFIFLLPFLIYFLRTNFLIFTLFVYTLLPFDVSIITKEVGILHIFNDFINTESLKSNQMEENVVTIGLGFFIKPFVPLLIFLYFIYYEKSYEYLKKK